ncbi:MAG: RHS repeat protein [Verrucomicrobia bacterium]|nr:RHS repeat protein [Verrucomicrobiota bacterium]
MKYLIVFLLIIQFTLQASPSSCFEEEDPTLFHHVNVITGHLNLCFQDAIFEGGMPLSITRTYSSGGALENSVLTDPTFEKGWSIFPHLRLYWDGGYSFDHETLKIYLLDKGGSPVKYAHKKGTKDKYYLYPVEFNKYRASSVNSRKNPEHNHIKINPKERTATLYCADGSVLHYSDIGSSFGYLEYEILPSKHRINYTYENNRLSYVELQNPNGTKALATITFDTIEEEDQTKFIAKTSDGKTLTYELFTYNEKDYIRDVTSNCRPVEHYSYEGRKGIGARVSAMALGHKDQFTASYYRPSSEKEEKKWAKEVPKKNYSADKVHILESPVGPNGEWLPIATFTYEKEYTDVRDVDNLLIRYHHTNHKLNAIEYFDKNDQLHSVLKFFWAKNNLQTKALFDSKGKALFAKTFIYNENDQVIEENFHGSFTGRKHDSLTINSKGEVDGGEKISKTFKYAGKLIHEEKEIGGLTTQYFYKLGTDLLVCKFILKDREILLREFYYYDTDNLLIREVKDDGQASHENNLSNVTERHIKTYERSPHNGLCLSVTESYLDLRDHTERQLIKRTFTYTPRCQIETETLFDSNNRKRYTLETKYDPKGNIKLKTTPLGYQNTYDYDSVGNPIEIKEVGKLRQQIDYDKTGRPIRSIEIDSLGNEKITETSYDLKGRPLIQVDSKGNPTKQVYDEFGNCIQIHFSEALDEKLEPYTPIATFTHDIQGNIISHSDPLGHKTISAYNTLRKPVRVEYPDGGIIRYVYNLNGTLAQTTHPDGTQDHYTYDPFQRQDSKKTYSAEGTLLSEETWVYRGFHLYSYTNPEGLTTTYSYDGAGRKIAEQAEDRDLTFTYDPLGQLERATQGGYSKFTVHNEEGDIVQQWEEDQEGTIENLTTFTYDHERRKEKAIRPTSQGEAQDLFTYDSEGRLHQHTDPHGEITEFIYSEETINDLGQNVLTKTTIDQLGNRSIETFDALNRLVQIEKKDPNERTVAKEQLLYDRSGNKARHTTTIYQDQTPIKTYSVRWDYDSRGRVIRERENDHKITTFQYDKKGRLRIKKQPNGTNIYFNYDGLDRLIELYSSDNKVNYTYSYLAGPSPISAYDKVHNLLWTRTYNKFGQMTSETSPKKTTLKWDYDNRGRCELLTLPDATAIQYNYTNLHLFQIIRLDTNGTPKYAHTYTQFDENGHIAQEELIHQLGTLTTRYDLFERPSEQISPYNTAYIDYGPSGLVGKIESSLLGSKDYEYDPLDQLRQEGPKTYHFDSLGNPLNAEVNTLNQISATDNIHLIYDTNGNPTQRLTPEGTTLYTYDPLNRLCSIEKPGQPPVQFLYDPFSRLYARTNDTTEYFLYDDEIEIGLLNGQNKIIELKVIGLGIAADIGAAVAIELNNHAYAPLHDFSGNIIGLVSSTGKLVETYDITAFGQEHCSRSPINPWRFNSKRSIEGLIFFGNRFYDPQLGRWLTPDPAGFIDGFNLYLYVHNSPLNRLDLFGLDTVTMEMRYEQEFYHNPYPKNYQNSSANNRLIPLSVTVNGIQIDWLISSNVLHKIKVSPEEIKAGKINILKHFHELFPNEGQYIAMTLFQNGVNTVIAEQPEMAQSIMDKIGNEDHVFIGMHIETQGIFRDLSRASKERKSEETPTTALMRQALVAIIDQMHNINPQLILLYIAHSRAGATYNSTFNGMTPEQKNLLRQHIYFIGVAPASPISINQAKIAYNFYSTGDHITGRFGKKALAGPNRFDYSIKFINKSSGNILKEHAFLGDTCQYELKNQLKIAGGDYQFYGK